jgi:hypothetical protein
MKVENKPILQVQEKNQLKGHAHSESSVVLRKATPKPRHLENQNSYYSCLSHTVVTGDQLFPKPSRNTTGNNAPRPTHAGRP